MFETGSVGSLETQLLFFFYALPFFCFYLYSVIRSLYFLFQYLYLLCLDFCSAHFHLYSTLYVCISFVLQFIFNNFSKDIPRQRETQKKNIVKYFFYIKMLLSNLVSFIELNWHFIPVRLLQVSRSVNVVSKGSISGCGRQYCQ